MTPDLAPDQRIVDHDADSGERTYAVFTHLTLLTVAVIPILPVLIMWLIKKNDSPFLDDHGREALNFQISLVIYSIAIIPLIACFTLGFGVLLYVPLYALGIVGMILGAMAANRGEFFRYPATIRLV